MDASFKESPNKLTIALNGDLIGGADAMKFSTTLRETLASKTVGQVEVDAAGVGFVNSSGLGMLLSTRQAALEHGAEFRLQHAGEQLKSLLNITKLTELLGS
jgi:anti-sigma B factor antagonist